MIAVHSACRTFWIHIYYVYYGQPGASMDLLASDQAGQVFATEVAGFVETVFRPR